MSSILVTAELSNTPFSAAVGSFSKDISKFNCCWVNSSSLISYCRLDSCLSWCLNLQQRRGQQNYFSTFSRNLLKLSILEADGKLLDRCQVVRAQIYYWECLFVGIISLVKLKKRKPCRFQILSDRFHAVFLLLKT